MDCFDVQSAHHHLHNQHAQLASSSASSVHPDSLHERPEKYTKPARPRNGPRSTAAGQRPRLSLASLIGQAVLSSPEQKARLGGIYEWIADRYPEYYRLNQGGWQNSIRHNLTINKAFVRLPKAPTDEPGKGAFWTVHPDHLEEFKDGVFVGKIRGAEYRAMPKLKSNRRSSYSGPVKRHRDFVADFGFEFVGIPDNQQNNTVTGHTGGGDFKLGDSGEQQFHCDEHTFVADQDAYGFSGPPPVGSVGGSNGQSNSLFLPNNTMPLPNLMASSGLPQPFTTHNPNAMMYGYMMPPPVPSGLWQGGQQMPQLVRSQSSFSFGLSPLGSSSTSPRHDQLPMVECDDATIMPMEPHPQTLHHHSHHLNATHESTESGHFQGYYPPGVQAGDENGISYADEFQSKDNLRSKSSTPLHIMAGPAADTTGDPLCADSGAI